MDLKIIEELLAKSTPEWAAKKVGSGIGHAALKNVDRVPKERKNLEQPPHKPKDPVLRKLADKVQKVGEHTRSHYKMSPSDAVKYQNMAHAEANRVVGRKSFDETTAEYFAKCYSHVLDGETEEGLKGKKKQAPKADGHVLGADPNDKRGSEHEMVEKKEPEAYKSLDERICDIHKARYDTKPPTEREGVVSQTEGYGDHPDSLHTTSPGGDVDKLTQKYYAYDKDKQEIETGHTKQSRTGKHGIKTTIPASAKYEEELKNASVVSAIDALLEKGRLRQVNKVKEGGAASGVRRPYLSEEQKKKIIEGSAAKVKAYRTEGYMPDKSDSPEVREQDRDPSNKSMKSIVDELVEKSMYDIVHHKRFSKMDPDAGIDKKKEEAMETGPTDKGKYIPGSKTFNNPQDSQDPKIRYKSLDERICDLTKDMSSQRERDIHDAVMTVRLSREGHPETNRAAEKMDVNPSDVQRASSMLEGFHNTKQTTLKSVCDKWMKGHAGVISSGGPILPGAHPATLVKEKPMTYPTYHETEKNQEDIQSGKVYREQKAKKKIGAYFPPEVGEK